MLFSSMLFIWIYLPIVLVCNIIIHKYINIHISNYFLLFASLFFYAWGEPVYVLLMLASIFLNWLSGLLIVKYSNRRKFVLTACIILNLGLLIYFKYATLSVDIVNKIFDVQFPLPNILLPIGISFFTFQALSYVVDVYKNECSEQKSIIKLALYISFFPQLIAGPIVRYKDIELQIENRVLRSVQMAAGIRRFMYGLGKKVLISNVLAEGTDHIYSLNISEISSPLLWLASILYTFQIYYDFSGYSDMAIGLGKMFGFEFNENFRYPYTSLSIKEFWRRWHISLSSWFKEYVYIPLGGSRNNNRTTYRNLFIVFLLTGIWHGANYNFLIWGVYHGFFIIIERMGFDKVLNKCKPLAWIYTFFVVNFGWVIFRTEDILLALRYIKRMLLPWRYAELTYSFFEIFNGRMLFTLFCGIIGMGIFQRKLEKTTFEVKWRNNYFEILFCFVIFIFSIIYIASNSYNPFIYFRF